MYVYTYVCIYVYMCVCVCVYVCVYVCMYVRIYATRLSSNIHILLLLLLLHTEYPFIIDYRRYSCSPRGDQISGKDQTLVAGRRIGSVRGSAGRNSASIEGREVINK